MSNIAMAHEWIAFDAITNFFPDMKVTMDTRLDDLPLGKEALPGLHQTLREIFNNGMPSLERLANLETVGAVVNCVVNSVAAWRRQDIIKIKAANQSFSWIGVLFPSFRRT